MSEMKNICVSTTGEKKRLHYIDVAKGILILLVVYGHLYAWTTKLNPDAADYVLQSLNFFISFYMPAFFVITGFCSNFKKPFPVFFLSSFKAILLPGLFFSLFDAIINFNLNLQHFYRIGKEFLVYGGRYWFLSALFVARLVYWFLCNHLSINKTIICSILLFVASFILTQFYDYYEFWYFIHALLLTPYLCLGQILRYKNNTYFISAAIIYIITLFITVILSRMGIFQIKYIDAGFVMLVPAVVQSFININYSMFISLVLLSVSGSIMIIGLAKKIEKNMILEYMGQNSLIIYCVHGIILRKISWYLGESYFATFQYFMIVMLVFIFTILLSCAISYVLNCRYLKIFIGKF